MKPETIYEALAHTSDEYLDSAQLAMEQGKRRMGLRRAWLLAACITLAVAMVAVPIASYVNWLNDPLYDLPTIEINHEMLEGVFNPQSAIVGGEANTINYETVTVPDSEYLYLNKPPKSYYLPLYSIHNNAYELNEEEFKAFAQPRIDRFAQALNASIDHVEERDDSSLETLAWSVFAYTNDPQNFDIHLSAKQRKEEYWISHTSESDTITLDGEKIQIRPSDSDEAIARSLDGVRKKLNTIFDASLTDTMVRRNYDTLGNEMVQSISVYFYNSSVNPLSEGIDRYPVKYGDLIAVHFESTPYNAVADSTSAHMIQYRKSRTPVEERYEAVGKVKMLSLKEAEKLLCQGFCFADTARCPACIPEPNSPRDLTDYDYVSFAYHFSKDYEYGEVDQSLAIPFYVFYKYRETDENGLQVYDYTYVPAVEFEGIEKYFSS